MAATAPASKPAIPPNKKASANTVPNSNSNANAKSPQPIDQKALEKYLWGAATALRGTIDAGDYKQYIFPLLFFKRISDVYDEEFATALAESDGDREYAAFAEHHHFAVPDGAHWRDVRETTTNIGLALQNAMRAIEKANPNTLHGIFGDASWTNKNRLSDATLVDLIEHFSQQNLSTAHVPDDQLGNAYEYLIKEFADDSGHTAAEFYTNRTVVKLMTLIMNPQPGESVYDPTCGSGGLLLNCALQLKSEGQEYRNLKLYGQEINLITSAIARMNMFMHGIEEFDIVRGDTLANPGLLENDTLKTFNVILANPPYSIKSWDRKSFASDPYGRNLWGTPPQGCADYTFQQHIQKSLDADNGRSISLWPHGILFRDAEAHMRQQMLEQDLVECVIGLGPNLFYNSPMEACLLITRNNKPADRQGKVLMINAVKEVRQDKNIAYLEPEHIQRIHQAYQAFADEGGFCKVVDTQDILAQNASLNMSLYVSNVAAKTEQTSLSDALRDWQQASTKLKASMSELLGEEAPQAEADELDVEAIEQVFNNLDKSDWKTYRFDEICQSISERVDPTNTDLETYIGLEHLDSESIHIRRTGEPSDVKGQKLRFYPGDVIFGKRRAYQRKAAVATMHGFCSAHAMVLRANPEVIDPQLFPFFLHSDAFMDRAVDISVGSLSPTINWRELSSQTFFLPESETQIKLLKLFRLADIYSEQVLNELNVLTTTKNSIFNQLRAKSLESYQVLGELAEKITSGGTPARTQPEYFNGDISWVKTKELNGAVISETEETITDLGLKASSAKLLPTNTILLAMYGATVGKLAIIGREMACNQACCAIIINEDDQCPLFIFYYLAALKKRLIALSVGSAQPNISSTLVKRLKIPLLPLNEQQAYSAKLKSIDNLIELHEDMLSKTKVVLRNSQKVVA